MKTCHDNWLFIAAERKNFAYRNDECCDAAVTADTKKEIITFETTCTPFWGERVGTVFVCLRGGCLGLLLGKDRLRSSILGPEVLR